MRESEREGGCELKGSVGVMLKCVQSNLPLFECQMWLVGVL